VLAVGLILIFSAHEYRPRIEQPYTVSEDVLNVLLYNKVKNINNYYAGTFLTRNGNITDTDQPLIEQIGEFYYRNQTKDCDFCMDLADRFLLNITQNLVPSEYNYIIMIDNNTIHTHASIGMEGARFITPARAIVHGIYNETELFGPFLVEVLSWG